MYKICNPQTQMQVKLDKLKAWKSETKDRLEAVETVVEEKKQRKKRSRMDD